MPEPHNRVVPVYPDTDGLPASRPHAFINDNGVVSRAAFPSPERRFRADGRPPGTVGYRIPVAGIRSQFPGFSPHAGGLPVIAVIAARGPRAPVGPAVHVAISLCGHVVGQVARVDLGHVTERWGQRDGGQAPAGPIPHDEIVEFQLLEGGTDVGRVKIGFSLTRKPVIESHHYKRQGK